MEKLNWRFREAFFMNFLMVFAPFFLFLIIHCYFFRLPGIANSKWQVLLDNLPQLFLFLFVLFSVMKVKSLSLSESLGFLGFKKPNGVQVLVGIFCLSPVFFFNFISYEQNIKAGTQYVFRQDWYSFLIFIFLNALFEESIFRGFFFQRLRPGRSFVSAAFLSGVLWAFWHLVVIATPMPIRDFKFAIFQMFSAMLGAIILSFPSAYVFEKGGNVIWGWLLVHMGVDSVLLFGSQYSFGFTYGIYSKYRWVGLILMAAITFPVVARFLTYRDKEMKKSKY